MTQTHNDNPTTSCLLDRDEWRKAIIRQIIHAEPPKVIGIHGTWGTGKTSLMAQMYTDLGGNHIFKSEDDVPKEFQTSLKDIRPVWFEAWQYQHEPNILAALLKEMRDQLARPFKLWNRVKEDALVATASVLQSISFKFKAFGAEFGVQNIYGNVRDNLNAIQKERISEPLDAVMEKRLLKEAVDQLLCLDFVGKANRPNRKAVIFIDDLDRCMPDTAFRILESIKVYLNLENCVFVLGMDLEGVERILGRYYEKQFPAELGSNTGLKNQSRLYLEKICQDVYHLPVPNQNQKIHYLRELLMGDRLGTAKAQLDSLLKIAKEFDILPPFPRSIKIFANVIISHAAKSNICNFLQDEKQAESNQKAFLIIAYLYAFHYEVYQLVMLYPEFYNEVFHAFCSNPFDFLPNQDENRKGGKGSHRVLDSLTVRIDPTSVSEKIGSDTLESRTDAILHNVYPDRNFRQVLWIRRLVRDTGALSTPMLESLKM